ncbi:MAG TPA: hypothetical protein DCQ13_01665 [Firmicutes bacterium]|nr:hypothetical protein [Bacillota bacterium]
MAYANQHEWQAERNAQLLAERIMSPAETAYPDWVITIAFYRALHLVDMALAARKGIIDIQNHDERKQHICSYLRGSFGNYQTLEDLSRKARYSAIEPTCDDIQDALELLQRIEEAVQR